MTDEQVREIRAAYFKAVAVPYAKAWCERFDEWFVKHVLRLP